MRVFPPRAGKHLIPLVNGVLPRLEAWTRDQVTLAKAAEAAGDDYEGQTPSADLCKAISGLLGCVHPRRRSVALWFTARGSPGLRAPSASRFNPSRPLPRPPPSPSFPPPRSDKIGRAHV